MALPLNNPITYYRGDTLNIPIVYGTETLDANGNPIPSSFTAYDMTGGSLRAQIKINTNYATTALASFNITNFVPASGSFTLNLPASTFASTDAFTGGGLVAYYDVEYTDSNGNVTTLLNGEFIMTDDVSHA